jgi:ATP-dependent protease Clp ATPase subunit|tara:strand:+ start:739 stop:1035 length:297 start_codon:yes stop_codon:yes gene_type:complete
MAREKMKTFKEFVKFQKVTVKDKSGKSHTQQTRIRPDTTHVAIMHYGAIAGTNLATAVKANTSLNFGTEKSLDKVISHAKKKFNLKTVEIQKLDKKYL